MREKIFYCLKIISMVTFLGFLVYGFNCFFNQASSIEDENIELMWGITGTPIKLDFLQTEMEFVYGYESCSNDCSLGDEGCCDVKINCYDYVGDINVVCSSDYLNFYMSEGEDSSTKILHIKGLDKEPANNFYNDLGELVKTPTVITLEANQYNSFTWGNKQFSINVLPMMLSEIEWITTELPYNGLPQTPVGKPLGLINDDECGVTFDTEGGTDVGNYQATVKGFTNKNYVLDSNSLISVDYSIKPGVLRIKPVLDVTYGQEIDYSKLTYEYDGLLNVDSSIEEYLTSEVDYNKFDSIYDANGKPFNYEINTIIENYSNPNFTVEIEEGLLEVKKAIIDIEYSTNEINITYGDKVDLSNIDVNYIGGIVDEGQSLESLGFELVSDYNTLDSIYDEEGNIIEYFISLKADYSNYDISTSPVKVNISPIVISELEIIDTEFDYTGQHFLPIVKPIGVINNDSCNVVFDNKGNVDFGTYSVNAIGLDNNNYKLNENVQIEYKINKINVDEFELENKESEYTGYAYKILASVPAGIEDVTYKYYLDGNEIDEIINVGVYDVEAIYTVNYNYNEVSNKYSKITIKPKGITIVLDYSNLVFNENEQNVDIKYEGLIGNDTLNPDIEGSTSGVNAGDYEFSVSSGNPNYVIIKPTQSWSIGKTNASISGIKNTTQVYNGLPFILTEDLPDGVVVKYEITLNGNSVDNIVNAGEYVVKSIYTTNGNYNDIADKETIINIKPKEITVIFEFVNGAYTGLEQKPNITFDGVVEGDEVIPEIEGDSSATSAGSYNTTVTNTNNPNYVLSGNLSKDWVIEKADISVPSLADKEKTYDGLPYVLSNDSIKGIEKINYSITCNNEAVLEIKNAGTYLVTASYVVEDNYNEVSPQTMEIAIKPKKVSINFTETTKTFNSSEQELVVSIDGLIEGDIINLDITGNKATEVGSYTAFINSLGNNNYELEGENSCEWEIIPLVVEDNIDDIKPAPKEEFIDLSNGIQKEEVVSLALISMIVICLIAAPLYLFVKKF